MPAAEFKTPKFLYFDLGNVLLMFDHHRAARQLAEVFSTTAERVWQLAFVPGGLNHQLDAGTLSTEAFYETLCKEFGSRPALADFAQAASDIFQLNWSLNTVVGRLWAAGHRLGILSNTSDLHWRFFADGRYGLIPPAFEQCTLSYRLQLMKPGPEIYLAAAAMAGVAPNEVFYVDDLLPNVEGALAVGFDAVQYTTTAAYVSALRARGVEFSY